MLFEINSFVRRWIKVKSRFTFLAKMFAKRAALYFFID